MRNGLKEESLRAVQRPEAEFKVRELERPVIVRQPSQELGQPVGGRRPAHRIANRDLKPDPAIPARPVKAVPVGRTRRQTVSRIRHGGDLNEISRRRGKLAG